MRTLLIVGNWKMNKTASEAARFIGELSRHLTKTPTGVELVVAPPFTALESVGRVLGSESPIQLGAQNLFWETQGAYTGEISAPMLKDLGCRYVILGHSERRTLFGERGDGIRKKLQAAFAHGLRPILCIGESLTQREAGSTDDVLAQQIHESLAGFAAEALETSPSRMSRSGRSEPADRLPLSKPLQPIRRFELFLPPPPLPSSPNGRGFCMEAA